MPRALLISVRCHDGRYHGTGDWPPSPARLFQALVAGAARGAALADEDRAALGWLETLKPPVIAAPKSLPARGFTTYVPNNDLDAVGGDPRRIGEIRIAKSIKPRLFDAMGSFLYAWCYAPDDAAEHHACGITRIAERLYQLGRGVDMAWAWAEVVDEAEIEARLAAHGGILHRPSDRGADMALLCPQPGSLTSLEERFRAGRNRFAEIGNGKKRVQLFSQPPKPRFRAVSYDCPPTYQLFDLRETESLKAEPGFAPWPLTRTVDLVTIIRTRAVDRLMEALPDQAASIARILVGRNASEADKAQRVRIVPLPSIGHIHVDPAIRRVLIEIPPNCPIAANDIAWAFSGLELGIDHQTGEVLREGRPVLVPTEDQSMPGRYQRKSRLWRTITPVALPPPAARRRTDRSRQSDAKDGAERLLEQRRAAGAILQALRHAGFGSVPATIRVQREPFTARGERVEPFAPGTRFAAARLWHVEIGFAEPVKGPLLLGDGRYLGLGLMVPVETAPREVVVFSLPLEPRIAVADQPDLLQAVRRALMALARDGDGKVPPLFSGHEPDGAPARSGRHRHIFLAGADLDGDGWIDQVIVAAPWAGASQDSPSRADAALFDDIVSSLATVRAGRLGVIPLQPVPAEPQLIGPARCWESHTDYRPTRHAGRGKEPNAALLQDVIAECERRGLPKPEPELLEVFTGPKDGVTARLRLRFAVAVTGPILLGRDSHRGGGLFLARK
jgi:CRISPR-associated protein Csb2